MVPEPDPTAFALLAGHVPQAVVQYGPDRRIRFVNGAFEALTGMQAADVIGRTLAGSGLPASIAALWDGAVDLAARSATRVELQHDLAAAGDTLLLRTVFVSQGGPDGAVLSITIDRTVEAEQHERLRREAAETAHTHRLASDFVALVSHELRTPLQAVLGFADLLASGARGPLTEGQADYVGEILDSGRSLLGLVDDILDLSSLDAPDAIDRRGCAAWEVFDAALEAIGPLARQRGVPIEAAITTGDGFRGDGQRLRQAVTTLLSNAVEASSEGCRVRLAASIEPISGDLIIEVGDDAECWRPEDLGKVFVPFFPGRGARSRAGLTLAVTQRVVALHGGTIAVRGVRGGGCEFHVRIPQPVATENA